MCGARTALGSVEECVFAIATRLGSLDSLDSLDIALSDGFTGDGEDAVGGGLRRRGCPRGGGGEFRCGDASDASGTPSAKRARTIESEDPPTVPMTYFNDENDAELNHAADDAFVVGGPTSLHVCVCVFVCVRCCCIAVQSITRMLFEYRSC